MRRLPLAGRTLIVFVAAAGTATLLARAPDLARWGGADLGAFALLTAGIALTEQFQIPLRLGSETLNFSLTEAVWVGALLLARPSVVTMAVATGVALGQGLRRRPLHKVAFNAGQFLLALTAAQLVVGAVRSSNVLRPMSFLAVGLGMAAYTALNAGLVALVISLVQGKPIGSVLLPPLPENLVHFSVNMAIGLAAVVLWEATPGALPLLVPPLAMSFLAYRALLEGFRITGRLRELAL